MRFRQSATAFFGHSSCYIYIGQGISLERLFINGVHTERPHGPVWADSCVSVGQMRRSAGPALSPSASQSVHTRRKVFTLQTLPACEKSFDGGLGQLSWIHAGFECLDKWFEQTLTWFWQEFPQLPAGREGEFPEAVSATRLLCSSIRLQPWWGQNIISGFSVDPGIQ